jgi:hypothetical protein
MTDKTGNEIGNYFSFAYVFSHVILFSGKGMIQGETLYSVLPLPIFHILLASLRTAFLINSTESAYHKQCHSYYNKSALVSLQHTSKTYPILPRTFTSTISAGRALLRNFKKLLRPLVNPSSSLSALKYPQTTQNRHKPQKSTINRPKPPETTINPPETARNHSNHLIHTRNIHYDPVQSYDNG